MRPAFGLKHYALLALLLSSRYKSITRMMSRTKTRRRSVPLGPMSLDKVLTLCIAIVVVTLLVACLSQWIKQKSAERRRNKSGEQQEANAGEQQPRPSSDRGDLGASSCQEGKGPVFLDQPGSGSGGVRTGNVRVRGGNGRVEARKKAGESG